MKNIQMCVPCALNFFLRYYTSLPTLPPIFIEFRCTVKKIWEVQILKKLLSNAGQISERLHFFNDFELVRSFERLSEIFWKLQVLTTYVSTWMCVSFIKKWSPDKNFWQVQNRKNGAKPTHNYSWFSGFGDKKVFCCWNFHYF